MPGFLLHVGATVFCQHAGQATPTAPDPRVRLGGQPAVTQPYPYTVAGCALLSTTSPPCITAQWVTAATRVRAGGLPVLLQDSQAVCAPSGTGLMVAVTQTRVRGI
jgi:uncharacterized Zn-binding protein involved in type VI secretion